MRGGLILAYPLISGLVWAAGGAVWAQIGSALVFAAYAATRTSAEEGKVNKQSGKKGLSGWTSGVVSSKTEPCLITIDGVQYDCSAWVPQHPGGRVILNFHNGDASDVFAAMHPKSAYGVLKKFKSQPAAPNNGPTARVAAERRMEELEFRKMREQFETEGLFQARPLDITLRTLAVVVFFPLSALVGYLSAGSVSGAALAGLLFATGMSQAGWLSHDYIHHQVFQRRKYGDLAGVFVGSMLQGFSVRWWKDKHNTHHASSNVHGQDPDIDTVPLLAWDEMDIPRVKTLGPFWQFWVRHQRLIFLPLMAAAQVSWRAQSIFTACSSTKYAMKAEESVGLLAHYVMYFALAWCSAGSVLSLCVYVFMAEAMGGLLKAIPFVLNHNGRPIVGEDHSWSFAKLQIITGRDVRPSPVMNWFMGGLNFQIEHHLFPMMPRHNLPVIKPRVKEYCEKLGIEYAETGFVQGVREVFASLARVERLV